MNDPNLTKAAGKVPRKGLERWARAALPSSDVPFTFWHVLLILLLVLIGPLVALAPGMLSDLGGVRIGDVYHPVVSSWELGQLAKIAVALVYVWALLGVRVMHPLTALGLFGVLVWLGFRISELRITHEPLTVSWLTLFIALCFLPVRTIVRPNEYELAERYRQQQKETHED